MRNALILYCSSPYCQYFLLQKKKNRKQQTTSYTSVKFFSQGHLECTRKASLPYPFESLLLIHSNAECVAPQEVVKCSHRKVSINMHICTKLYNIKNIYFGVHGNSHTHITTQTHTPQFFLTVRATRKFPQLSVPATVWCDLVERAGMTEDCAGFYPIVVKLQREVSTMLALLVGIFRRI